MDPAGGNEMIQRNGKQVRGASKTRTRVRRRRRNQRPQMETGGYESTPSRLSLFIDPPREKPVYTIGELVMTAYERAALLAEDAATEALVATRLLAEWLIHARPTTSAAPTAAERTHMGQGVSRRASENRVHRVPSRRGVFANAPAFRTAAAA
jgi:hypothetical protein